MEPSYLDLYTLVKLFKENEFQQIFIARDNNNNQSVIVNIISAFENNSLWNSIEKYYTNIFKQVVHIEKLEDKIIIVTEITDALSINEYLDSFSPSLGERVYLIYEYLKSIKKYDPLPNNIKTILVDWGQIIMEEKILSLDELIIFNKDSLNINSFNHVLDKIMQVLKQLMSPSQIDLAELPLYVATMSLIDEIQKNKSEYVDINSIFNALINVDVINKSISSMEKYIQASGNNINSATNHIKDNNSLPHKTLGQSFDMLYSDALAPDGMSTMLKITLSVIGVLALATGVFFLLKSKLQL